MSKYVYALIVVFIIEFALWIFAGTTYANSSLFNFVTNPSTTSPFYTTLYLAIIGLSAFTIVASAFYNINIYGVYAAIAAVFLTFFMSVIHLSEFVYGELSASLSSEFATIISMLIIAPFAITYLLATVEWIKGGG